MVARVKLGIVAVAVFLLGCGAALQAAETYYVAGVVAVISAGDAKQVVIMSPDWEKITSLMAFGEDPEALMSEDDWTIYYVVDNENAKKLAEMEGQLVAVKAQATEDEDGDVHLEVSKFKAIEDQEAKALKKVQEKENLDPTKLKKPGKK